jgi:hypothetical protein
MKRHDLEPVSLVFGLLFLLIGVPALLGRLDLADAGWHRIWPYPVIGLGLLIVVLAFRRDRRSPGRPAQPEDEEAL